MTKMAETVPMAIVAIESPVNHHCRYIGEIVSEGVLPFNGYPDLDIAISWRLHCYHLNGTNGDEVYHWCHWMYSPLATMDHHSFHFCRRWWQWRLWRNDQFVMTPMPFFSFATFCICTLQIKRDFGKIMQLSDAKDLNLTLISTFLTIRAMRCAVHKLIN